MPLLRVNARVPLVWQATMRVPVELDGAAAVDALDTVDVEALDIVGAVDMVTLEAINVIDVAGFGA